MLEEVLTRRFAKIENENENIKPDIIIIDGGKGHLNITKKILNNLKYKKIKIIAMAKGKDRNKGREIIYFDRESKVLKFNNILLHFIQRIRDEAHRFAINSHRKRRFYETIASVLDEIPGVGSKRKKQLIYHFGGVENVKKAKLEDLNNVKGISNSLAKEIFDFFDSQ
tara:strand:- start:91 stop:594 length:504 start_codon:yes stop_codon:yes gene_type:complete